MRAEVASLADILAEVPHHPVGRLHTPINAGLNTNITLIWITLYGLCHNGHKADHLLSLWMDVVPWISEVFTTKIEQ